MRYVIAHAVLAAIAGVMGAGVTVMIMLNVTETTPYIAAMGALVVLVVSWFPFAIALNETVGEYNALKRRRRRKVAAMRRHPSNTKRR